MNETISAISFGDISGQKQVNALLGQEGIHRDENLDYTCGVFDEDYNLIATGSCFGNTMRCLAVSRQHQGEGLLNQVVGHLMEVQAQRGNTHLFLYTKIRNVKFFSDLGFYEIAQVKGELVFMENRRNGFSGYCAALEKNRREGKSAAIVMNANPFTLGHRHLAERAAKENDTVHLFILSENAGPIPFEIRRRLVHEGVADIPNVLCHDSGEYIISSATFPSYFLKDEDAVILTHAALDIEVFAKIARCLNITRRYVGEEKSSHVTSLYNGVMAERLPQLGIECRIIPRLEADGAPVSASTVRKAVHEGEMDKLKGLLPESTLRYFLSREALPVIEAIKTAKNVVHY